MQVYGDKSKVSVGNFTARVLSKITIAGYTLGPITFPNGIIVPHMKLFYGAGLKSGHRTVCTVAPRGTLFSTGQYRRMYWLDKVTDVFLLQQPAERLLAP